VIRVRTKADLGSDEQDGMDYAVSAKAGLGLQELLAAVRQAVKVRLGEIELATPVITRVRQQLALIEARRELQTFLEYWETGSTPAVVAAVHVRDTIHALAELIGKIDIETILGVVFERFCVGK
jgi:tRNA modification GTPase